MKVVIASAALRSALGTSKDEVAEALLTGKCGVTTLTYEHFGKRDYLYYPIKNSPPLDQEGRLQQLLDSCVSEALDTSGLSQTVLQQAPLFLGTSSYTIADEEQRLHRLLNQGEVSTIPDSLCGDMAQQLARRFSLRGGVYSFNTACTSSANALLYARQAVASGQVPAALVVGAEFFNHTTLYGFDSLQLLSRDNLKPFDRGRNGLVLGEGVSAIVVTSEKQELGSAEWGDIIVHGGDNGCDPNGMTCSSAESMASVMAGALQNAGYCNDDIALVKAHATGSESNDAAEARSMHLQFGAKLPEVTALKGSLGHTLGGSGVLELVSLAACLRRGEIPQTSGFSELDPELDITPLRQNKTFSGGPVMLNYFGFGGNNTSLILEVGA
jgi:3-oxoacyl-[acyl-carrier-protein] synthase-1